MCVILYTFFFHLSWIFFPSYYSFSTRCSVFGFPMLHFTVLFSWSYFNCRKDTYGVFSEPVDINDVMTCS